MGAELPRAGWYPDPQDASKLRYWDGEGWTAHTSVGTVSPRGLPPPLPPSVQPGWYRDAFIPTRARYWDGKAWHLHTYPISAPADEAPTSTSGPTGAARQLTLHSEHGSADRPGRPVHLRRSVWMGAAGVFALAIVGTAFAMSNGHSPHGAASARVTQLSSGAPPRAGASTSTTVTRAPTTTVDAAAAWRSTYWAPFLTTMERDRIAVSTAITRANTAGRAAVVQAGHQLATDVSTFSAYPPLSNPGAEQHWQALLADLSTAASEAATYSGSPASASVVSNSLLQALSEEQQIIGIMGWK